MSIEVGRKWVKDGEMVETIKGKIEYFEGYKIIWFITLSDGLLHVLTECDFLDQYKPYEPVYEYQYVLRNYIDCPIYESQRYYKDDNEFLEREVNDKNFKTFQRLDFTKRERT